jgi:hypothetical protein
MRWLNWRASSVRPYRLPEEAAKAGAVRVHHLRRLHLDIRAGAHEQEQRDEERRPPGSGVGERRSQVRVRDRHPPTARGRLGGVGCAGWVGGDTLGAWTGWLRRVGRVSEATFEGEGNACEPRPRTRDHLARSGTLLHVREVF